MYLLQMRLLMDMATYALDISSIFSQSSSSVNGKIDWSFLIPNTKMLGQESFAYLGLGGIFLLIFLIIIFISNYNIFIKDEKVSFLLFNYINFFNYSDYQIKFTYLEV